MSSLCGLARTGRSGASGGSALKIQQHSEKGKHPALSHYRHFVWHGISDCSIQLRFPACSIHFGDVLFRYLSGRRGTPLVPAASDLFSLSASNPLRGFIAHFRLADLFDFIIISLFPLPITFGFPFFRQNGRLRRCLRGGVLR